MRKHQLEGGMACKARLQDPPTHRPALDAVLHHVNLQAVPSHLKQPQCSRLPRRQAVAHFAGGDTAWTPACMWVSGHLSGEEDGQRPEPERAEQTDDVVEELRH